MNMPWYLQRKHYLALVAGLGGMETVPQVSRAQWAAGGAVPGPLLSIGSAGANVGLSWLVPSTSFVLQQSSDLTLANWVDLTNPPTLNFANLHNQVTLPRLPRNTFYRLQQQ